MALPTTALTLHTDAKTNTDVWQFLQAGSPYHNTPGTNGTEIDVWDDVEHGVFIWLGFGTSPIYQVTTPLMPHPCLSFDGSGNYRLYDDTGLVTKIASDVFSQSLTVTLALYVTSISTNAGTAYDNEAVIADGSALIGIHFRDNTTATDDENLVNSRYKIIMYVWDGSEKKKELSIPLATSFYARFRKDASTIYLSVNGGAEVSIGYGAPTTMGGFLRIGGDGTGTHLYHGRIGELVLRNDDITGSDITDEDAYFATWLATAPTSHTLTGPTTGTTGSASSNFTITLDQPADITYTFTPSGTNGTVTFVPPTPAITAGNTAITFTANAALDGAHTIEVNDDAALTDIGSITYTTSAASGGNLQGSLVGGSLVNGILLGAS